MASTSRRASSTIGALRGVGPPQPHTGILVLIGADASGKKELLAIDDGFRESEQAWHELLVRLRDEKGLVIDPELATGDGALGFWKAAKKVWPKVKQQRSTLV